MQRSRAIKVCALAFALACLAADPPSGQQETDEAAPPEKQSEKQQKADEVQGGEVAEPSRRARASESKVWWNTPAVVERLSLTDEQREKMDGYLEAYRQTESGENRRPSFGDALADGNWREARKELKQLEDQAVASIRVRGELKINVLSALSDDQRKTLVERYRRLITQRWTQAMRQPERTGQKPGKAEQPSE